MVTKIKTERHQALTFSLPEDEYEALRLYCFLSRLHMTDFIRLAVNERLERVQHKNGRQEQEEQRQEAS